MFIQVSPIADGRPVTDSIICFVSSKECKWPIFRLGKVLSCQYSDNEEIDDTVTVQFLGFDPRNAVPGDEFTSFYRLCWRDRNDGKEIQQDGVPQQSHDKLIKEQVSLHYDLLAADIEFTQNMSYVYGKIKQNDRNVISKEFESHQKEFPAHHQTVET